MNRLKILLILLGIILLFLVIVGCKSTKHAKCDAYSEVLSEDDTLITFTFPFVDSIIMESLHVHDESRQICCWIPKDTLVYSDTLRLKLIAKKSNYVR